MRQAALGLALVDNSAVAFHANGSIKVDVRIGQVHHQRARVFGIANANRLPFALSHETQAGLRCFGFQPVEVPVQHIVL